MTNGNDHNTGDFHFFRLYISDNKPSYKSLFLSVIKMWSCWVITRSIEWQIVYVYIAP